MRKMLVVIMGLLCMMYLCNSYADSYPATFSLRDGLKFGSSEDEIRDAMAGNGEHTGTAKLNWADLEFDGDVGGRDAIISFRLDSNKKLVEMAYQFKSPSISASVSTYNSYRELLTKKYGDELDIPNGKTHLLTGSVLSDILSSGIQAKSEWLIQDGDNYVKIDLIAFGVNVFGTTVSHSDISYVCFTQEEVNQAVEQNNDSQQAVLDDL